MAGTLLLLTLPNLAQAQLLAWLTSFSPSWNNGATSRTAYNAGGYTNLNLDVNVSISGGSFTQALGSSGSMTPTVSGATFTVPGSPSRLQLTPNFSSNSSYTTIVFTFTAPVQNVTFRIVDIDKNDAYSSTYFDRVTVTGQHGANNYNAALSRYSNTDPNFLVINGNVAHVNTANGQGGNSDSDNSDQRGTVNVSFGSTILSSVTIRYDNAPGAQSNPAAQAIAVGSMSFQEATTLPVSLISFAGALQNNDVLLKWTTAQELNSDHFQIERSQTGSDWTPIGTVAARGNSVSKTDYGFKDINPAATTLFYRLKQLDTDGKFTYSSVLRITKAVKNELLTYPNPIESLVNISVHSAAEQRLTARVYDAAGRLVHSYLYNASKGNNNFTVTGLEKLTAGVYMLTVSDAEEQVVGSSRILKK